MDNITFTVQMTVRQAQSIVDIRDRYWIDWPKDSREAMEAVEKAIKAALPKPIEEGCTVDLTDGSKGRVLDVFCDYAWVVRGDEAEPITRYLRGMRRVD